MDGKLLVLVDEIPANYEHHSVKDIYFLKSTIRYPEEDTDKIFVTWDAIIPKDTEFLDMCTYYARTYAKIPANFWLRRKGAIDPKNGNINDSIQESSYAQVLASNLNRIRKEAERGEDYQALAIDLSVEFPFLATQTFLEDFSQMLNNNGVVRIMLAHKKTTDPEEIRRREMLMDAWKNQNKFMRENASCAEFVPSVFYDDFSEVYSKSTSEMMKVYSLPIFGEPRR